MREHDCKLVPLRVVDPRFMPGCSVWHKTLGPAVVRSTALDGQSHVVEVVKYEGEYPLKTSISVMGCELAAA